MHAPPYSLALWVPTLDGPLPPPGSPIALPAFAHRPAADLERLAEADLRVVCARLDGDLTPLDLATRRAQFHHLQRQIADAALLGATLVWLDHPRDPSDHVAEAISLLDQFARARMLQLVLNPPRLDALLYAPPDECPSSPPLLLAPALTPALQQYLDTLGFDGLLVVAPPAPSDLLLGRTQP